jgi:hypothetical protein
MNHPIFQKKAKNKYRNRELSVTADDLCRDANLKIVDEIIMIN